MKFGISKQSSLVPSSPPVNTRRSSGLEQFFASFPPHESQSILDMSGASQANIMFITGLGHRLSSDDVIGTMEQCFGRNFLEGQQSEENVEKFLQQTLKFDDHAFDGVLVWDTLQFLRAPLIDRVIAELLRIVRPGGLLLVFFNADERASTLPLYNYRIQEQKSLVQVPRGSQQPGQYFQNRTVEKLFEKASSLKFFLTRDSLREVIVRR